MLQTIPACALVRICTLPSIAFSGVVHRRGVQPSRRNMGLTASRGHWLRIRPFVQYSLISVARNRGCKAKETHPGLAGPQGIHSEAGIDLQARDFSVAGRRYFIGVDQLMIEGEKYQLELIRNAQLVTNTCEVQPEGRFADADSLCALLNRVASHG